MCKIGIIGAGSFGRALGQVLERKNNEVLFYVRSQRDLQNTTTSLEKFFNECKTVFIVIPIENIYDLLSEIKFFVKPYHQLIHCIKGLYKSDDNISRDVVYPVSELITKITGNNNVGCLSGPNLANEIKNCQLTSAVIASKKKELIQNVKLLVSSEKFIIYGSEDILGVELCGICKNIIAIASGIMNGLGEGDNAKSLLMTIGFQEIKEVTKLFTESVDNKTFYSVAGIGDLIATCSSNLSRNFTVGNRISKGEKLQNILDEGITAEGLSTTYIIYHLVKQKGLKVPIIEAVFNIIFNNTDPKIITKIF